MLHFLTEILNTINGCFLLSGHVDKVSYSKYLSVESFGCSRYKIILETKSHFNSGLGKQDLWVKRQEQDTQIPTMGL
jgi:hypothetical protein